MKTSRRWLSFTEIDGSHRLMACLVLALGLFNLFFGEVVPAGGGLGWDGVTYANMVRNLGSMIGDGQLNHYYAQRILPSATVRGMLTVSRAPLTDANIIRAFDLYNLLLLFCGSIVWKHIADHFSLRVGGRWIGFSGIFVNFLISKQIMYCPVSTDVTALLVSLSLLFFYLKRRPLLLFLATVAGSFAWQITGLYGAMLIISMYMTLPADDVDQKALALEPKQATHPIQRLWLATLVLSVIGYLIVAYVWPATPQNPEQIGKLERFLAGAPSLLAVVIGLLMIIGSARTIRSVISDWKKIRPTLLILAAAALLIPAGIVKLISNPNLPDPNSFAQTLELVLLPLNGEGKFLMPLVTLTLFWGPTLLLLVICWKNVCVELRRLGPGVMAVVGMTLPLGLVTEPRFVLGAWPFVVLALVLVLERLRTSRSFMTAFFALSILYAQFWLKLNVAPWTGDDQGGLLDFPKQMLFMHYGPWMSWPSYFIQLPIVILSGLWLRQTLVRDATTPGRYWSLFEGSTLGKQASQETGAAHHPTLR